ncbi:hypothetical protein [Azospirillum sp. sgz302134]
MAIAPLPQKASKSNHSRSSTSHQYKQLIVSKLQNNVYKGDIVEGNTPLVGENVVAQNNHGLMSDALPGEKATPLRGLSSMRVWSRASYDRPGLSPAEDWE